MDVRARATDAPNYPEITYDTCEDMCSTHKQPGVGSIIVAGMEGRGSHNSDVFVHATVTTASLICVTTSRMKMASSNKYDMLQYLPHVRVIPLSTLSGTPSSRLLKALHVTS